MARPLTSPEERFVAFVDETSNCWEWTGCRLLRPDGSRAYGRFKLSDKTVYAHRWLWEYCFGSIPNGKELCHTCDNPPCVRPAHLYIGTAKSNSDDKFERNSDYLPGKINPAIKGSIARRKITKEEHHIIQDLYKTGTPVQQIAIQYGVHFMTIYRTLKRGCNE